MPTQTKKTRKKKTTGTTSRNGKKQTTDTKRRGGGRLRVVEKTTTPPPARKRPEPIQRHSKKCNVPAKDVERLKDAFVEEYRVCRNYSKAAEFCGLNRRTIFNWRQKDETFAARIDEAWESAIDELESEALKRAIKGWEEEVYNVHGYIGTRRKYDCALTIFMLKCNRGYKYADKPVEDDDSRLLKLRAFLESLDAESNAGGTRAKKKKRPQRKPNRRGAGPPPNDTTAQSA